MEEEIELILSISLLHHQKFIDEDTTIDNTIIPARTNRYILKNVRRGLHEFIPIIFEAQFFSLVNLTVHSVCLDQRFRISQMQLSEYSQLTHSEKQRLL